MTQPAIRLIASHGVRLDADMQRMREEDRRVRQGLAVGFGLGLIVWPLAIAFAWAIVAVARVARVDGAIAPPAATAPVIPWPGPRDRGRTP